MTMAQAFADLALALSTEADGPFFAARVVTRALAQDEGGDTSEDGPVYRPCWVQVDLAADVMRANGSVAGEARFMVLAATLSGGLGTDEEIEVLAGPHAGLWLVSSLERDPVAIGWVGRGRRG